MYPVCPPDCLLGLGLAYHWQCCGVEICISLISLLVPFLHFAMVQESTVVLNLQIQNGRRDTHAMAQEFQQTHLCGIVELGSARPSVSCRSVPRIKKVDCKDRAQPTPEAGLDLLHYKGKTTISVTSPNGMGWI